MRKPSPLKEWREALNPLAEVDFDIHESTRDIKVIWIDAGNGIMLPEAKRLRAWLDKAIAWMEAK